MPANFEVKQDFDINKYLGTWYEAFRSKHFRFGAGECVTANYSIRPDGYIRVFNSNIKYDAEGKLNNFRNKPSPGWAYQPDPEKKEGTLGVKFSVFQPFYGNYNVLETDYESFTIVYSKSDGCLGSREYCWLLTREPLDKDSDKIKEMRAMAKDYMEKNIDGFDWEGTMRQTL